MSRIIAACIVFVAAIGSCFTSAAHAAAPPLLAAGFRTGAPLVTLETPSPDSDAVAVFPPVVTPDPVVRWMADQVRQDAVRQYVGDLSGEWPVTIDGKPYRIKTRNVYSQQPISATVRFVGDHLAGLGLAVEKHRWGPATAPNVIGQKTGATRPGDIFMVTAHLDDMPDGPVAPGADDNASGSAAVLVAADILSQFSWDCTLRFALWTGEEIGLLGSDAYALRSRNQGENIAGVFNLDMIGWNTPGSPRDIDLHARSAMPATVDLANQAASILGAYGIALVPQVVSDGSGSSDHASFWKYGYTAILGIEDYYPPSQDFNPYYHKTTDTLSTLDLGYLTDYVKLVVAGTAHMAGCLTTGVLEGQVAAQHDGSSIASPEIRANDAAGREYKFRGGADGRYNQAVPPGSYTITASAYGYRSGTASGITPPPGGSTPTHFVLAAASPVPPQVSIALDTVGIELTWPHVSPDTAYEVHRTSMPYSVPDIGTRVTVINAGHPPVAGETLSCTEAESVPGGTPACRFYIVLGMNAAGSAATSTRTGAFRFELIPPGG